MISRFLAFFVLLLLLAACQQPVSDGALEPQREWVWWRGVNLAGAEFAADDDSSSGKPGDAKGNLPGTYNADYRYPIQSDVDYNKSKGMNIVRVPFRWERLQPQLFGNFNTTEWNRLKTFVRATIAKDVKVILDVHNYARYYGNVIGTNPVPTSAFNDLWKRLAREFKGDQRVIFGLMNEPYDVDSYRWVDAANAAIAAIRSTGADNLILVPGTRYTGAWTWFDSDQYGISNAEAMKQIKDPYNWYMIEFHQYMDLYASGTQETCTRNQYEPSSWTAAQIGVRRVEKVTKWLRANNLKGFMGEFSVGRNAPCYQALNNFVNHLESNADVWRGWTYWAGGDWWANDLNTLEPVGGKDRPQMDILEKYLPR